MAVPKRKMSRSNTRARRSQWKTTVTDLSTCSTCNQQKQAHMACPSCGTHNGRKYAEAILTEHQA